MNDYRTLSHPRPAQASLLPAWFLALGTFAIGTEGFMIAPLLPRIALDLGMSLSATAMLVTVFTLVLALSSPVLTVATASLKRRDMLALAMTLFTLGNLIAAFASGFATLMVARILMATAAGLYTPNANALAGVVVPAEKRGRALAVVSGGMTIAIALGLPLGSLVGHAFGWRATFLTVAAMGATAVTAVLLGVDRHAGTATPVAGIAERIGVIRVPAVQRPLLVTLFWSMGAYTAYPYIAPYLAHTLQFEDLQISATVTLWGVFAALGVFSGGALNDRFGPSRVISFSLVALSAAFLSLAVATSMGHGSALIFSLAGVALWGFSVWSFFPAQMAKLIEAGGSGKNALVLSLNTSTMYFGFSVGSAIGAEVLSRGQIWMIAALAALFAATARLLNGR